MPVTFAAEPTIVEDATRYAEHNGVTLEALLFDYLKTIANRERQRYAAPRPAFLNIRHRLSDEGTAELMAAQPDFGKIDEEMWK